MKKAGLPVSSTVEATAAAVVIVESSIGAAGLRIESRISMPGGSSEAVGSKGVKEEMAMVTYKGASGVDDVVLLEVV